MWSEDSEDVKSARIDRVLRALGWVSMGLLSIGLGGLVALAVFFLVPLVMQMEQDPNLSNPLSEETPGDGVEEQR